MLLLAGLGVIGLAVLVGYITARLRRDGGFWIVIVLGIIGFLLAIGAVVAGTSHATGRNGYLDPTTKTGEIPLLALGTDSSVEGSVFLGTGYVDEELVYRYIIETEFGAELREVEAWRARVREEPGTPRIEYWSNCDTWHLIPWPNCTRPLTVFVVPEGSIARYYAVAP